MELVELGLSVLGISSVAEQLLASQGGRGSLKSVSFVIQFCKCRNIYGRVRYTAPGVFTSLTLKESDPIQWDVEVQSTMRVTELHGEVVRCLRT
jgi:hypothetical protein